MARVSGGGSRIVFGLILILVGILLLLSRMGLFALGELMGTYWPMIIILVGLWQWANRRFRFCVWPLLLIFLGIFMQAAELDMLDSRGFGFLLGVLLLALGAMILLRQARPRVEAVHDSDVIDQWVIFGGAEEVVTSRHFSGGHATVLFGGIDYDMRQAALAEGEVTLNLSAIFGGIELTAPESWQITVDGTAILGGVEDRTGAPSSGNAQSGAHLRIRAVTIFGGIEIHR